MAAPRIEILKDLFENGRTGQNSAKVNKANAGPNALLDLNGKFIELR